MNAHDQLERQLRASVARSATRVRRRPDFRVALVAGTVVVTLVVVLAAVLGLRSGSIATPPTGSASPGIGPKPQDPGPIPKDVDDTAVAASWNRAAAEDRRCQVTGSVHGLDHGTPSPAMLSVLPALTRLAPLRRLPKRGLVSGQAPVGRVYVRYVRLARRTDTTNFFLVPIADFGSRPLSVPVADHCYELTVAALNAQMARVPAAERAATRRYGDAEFALGRYNRETSRPTEVVFLFLEQTDGGSGSPFTVSEIRQGRAFEIGPTSIIGIVRGGVARVTFMWRRLGTGWESSLSVKVVNDLVVAHVPKAARGARLTRMVWHSASGAVIKTINEKPFHP